MRLHLIELEKMRHRQQSSELRSALCRAVGADAAAKHQPAQVEQREPTLNRV